MPGEAMGVAVAVLAAAWAMLALPHYCLAAQYVVGDAQGWDISTDFNTWVSGKVFAVGDTLVFQYSPYHSLLEVKKGDYDSCKTDNVLQSYSDGNTQIRLSTPGERYFLCGASGHCLGGMRLAINVTSKAASAPAPAPLSSDGKPALPGPSTPSDSLPVGNKSTPAKSAAPNSSYDVNPFLVVIIGGCLMLWKLNTP